MYKIFINDKPLVLASPGEDLKGFENYSTQRIGDITLLDEIKKAEGMQFKGLLIICPDTQKTFDEMATHFISIKAAGGVVFNSRHELLLIKRLGKWDLPKGKIDSGEESAEAAVREVEEECGIKGLELLRLFDTSYHTYKMHGHRFLKITYWYLMRTDYNGVLVPQLEEHITEAQWFSKKELRLNEMETYTSIRNLLSQLDIG